MFSSQLHYLPLSPALFSIFAGILLALFILIQIGVLRYAYMRLGVGPGAALLLLLGSLIGSYFNIPVAELPDQPVMSGRRSRTLECITSCRSWSTGPEP